MVLAAAPPEALFGRPDLALETPQRHDIARSYWASLAGSLTVLYLRYSFHNGHFTTSALNQSTRLRILSLDGERCAGIVPLGPQVAFASAHIELSLPQLRDLKISDFQQVRVSLECPALQVLELEGLRPLEALEGMPQRLIKVALKGLTTGSLSLAEVFQGQRLEQYQSFGLVMPPEVYEDPAAQHIIKRVLGNGRLAYLNTNCPLEKLTPLEGAACALPNSLHSLKVHHPLEGGIPPVLEQLTNLRGLSIINTGDGPMHLDRPLDPFLEMAHLTALVLCGDPQKPGQAESLHGWTPGALKILAHATRRILEGNLMPCGRKIALLYANHSREIIGTKGIACLLP